MRKRFKRTKSGSNQKIADNFGLKKSNIIEDDGLNILLKKLTLHSQCNFPLKRKHTYKNTASWMLTAEKMLMIMLI